MYVSSLFIIVAVGLLATFLEANKYEGQSRLRLEKEVEVFGPQNSDWLKGKRVSETDLMSVTFALRHNREKLKSFEEYFWQVSDPNSSMYGKYLSIDEITESLGVEDAIIAKIMNFIQDHDISKSNLSLNRNKDKIILSNVSATAIENLLDCELYHYVHKLQSNLRQKSQSTALNIIRSTNGYTLPESIANYVSFVSELIRFPHVNTNPILKPQEENGDNDDEFTSCGNKCYGFTTPDVLQARYGYQTLASGDVASGNSMAVAEFQFQYYDTKDFDNFESICNTANPISVSKTVGSNIAAFCSLAGCVEALLDIEYINAVASPIPLTVYYSSTYSLLDWATKLNDDDNAELVHSVSYGNDEAQQTSEDYMQSCNTEFMKAGTRGLSLFFASGDQGVWGREGMSGDVFHPDFPGASPYITAVGGTNFVSQSHIGDEEVWNDGGGGFSDTFDIPDYQANAVAGYFKSGVDLPDSHYYNANGRGYPDVAALGGLGNPYCVSYRGGSVGGVGGTSASSPVVAGIFAQLNNIRLSAGKPALGFVNPLIYQNPNAFHDVTEGTNDGGYRVGFTAAKGWDPASGMGTPNYTALKKVVSNLQ